MTSLAAVDDSFAEQDSKLKLDVLLTSLVERGGSDLHITAGIGPCMRINGRLQPIADAPKLMPADTERLIKAVIRPDQWERFERDQELDTAYAIPGISRFRVNVYRQRGAIGAAFRSIPHH